jgi:ribosomal-protein-alanine N-acetyltransferase
MIVRLVPVQASHLNAILAIEQEANSAPWSERSFQLEIERPHGVFLTLLVDGEVRGYGGVWYVVDEAHITNVAVAADLRNQGLGRRIVVALLESAREAGMTCATLEVRAGNAAAIHLYESLGFRSIATRRAYYPDNREDAVVMWLYDLAQFDPAR